VAEHAGADELLVSGPVLDQLDGEEWRAKRKRLFRAKGVPKDLTIFALDPASG
jgi:adenylate cyclase